MPFLNNDSAFALIVPRTAGIATHAQVLGISLAMSPDVPSLSPAGKVQPFPRGFSANLGRNQASSFLTQQGFMKCSPILDSLKLRDRKIVA